MDFSLTRFLDRFAFKNPKKTPEEPKIIQSVVQSKHAKDKEYKQQGSRGVPVTALTDRNCTEDERFIFNYLERRRQMKGGKESGKGDSDSDQSDLDDDEFDSYLDGLSSKTSKVDYMKEMGGMPDSEQAAPGKKRKKQDLDEDDAEADDWDDVAGGEEDDEDMSDISMSGDDISDIDDGEDTDESAMEFSGSEDDEDDGDGQSRGGKNAKGLAVSDKAFARKLKSSTDMSSLFAAADDFGELLEATGKIKKHGTTDEVSTKDKATEKQLAWEQNRMKGGKSRGSGKSSHKSPGKFSKKMKR